MCSRSTASTKRERERESSLISFKKADVAAELATKKAEFNALQEQAQNKEETIKMQAALPRRKVELEQIEVRKQMEVAKARLVVYQQAEEADGNVGLAEDDLLHILPTQSGPKTTSSVAFQQSLPMEWNIPLKSVQTFQEQNLRPFHCSLKV